MHRDDMVNLANLVDRLGGVGLDRIRYQPPIGLATEEDMIRLYDDDVGLFELIDYTLVQKPPDFAKAVFCAKLSSELGRYIEPSGSAILLGAGAAYRLAPGLVRMPDISVMLWSSLPGQRIPKEPIPSLAPDLAIDVLSAENTPGEMRRKVHEYFSAGTRCAWLVDRKRQSVRVYHSATDFAERFGQDFVAAESVLPGFAISVTDLFERSRIAD